MAKRRSPSVVVDETAPLIPPQEQSELQQHGKSVLFRLLLCGFMASLSFSVTQVPLIYVFRLMTCDAYYQTHHDMTPPGLDRCNNRDVEAGTSRAVALVSASTTIFGVLNLFVTGWAIKRFGVKYALLFSVFWPAVRLAVQNVGVATGGAKGILIIQCSQVITVVGGPAGYLLALNSFVTEVVRHEARTGALGKLQGCTFFGTSIAYLAGGLIGDYFGIIAPFRVTLFLFLTSCAYVIVFLPWIAPNKEVAIEQTNGLSKFFGPLKMFTPHKWLLPSGKIQKEYGTLLLGIGVFLGVLATGYQSVLLQMYATNVFGFGTTSNGYLISLNTFVRGLFLTLAFPRIIAAGREWLSSKDAKAESKDAEIPDLPSDASDFAAVDALDNDEEPIEPPKQSNEKETFAFDLLYVRYSLLADAILTGAATFVGKGWQMYLIAFLLPLAAGTGSSAKGTILQMCPATQRADALSAITLVEMVARLLTTTVFGLVFAVLAQVGLTHLVFTCNAAVALVGFCVLLFSRFPPDGSKRFDETTNGNETDETI